MKGRVILQFLGAISILFHFAICQECVPDGRIRPGDGIDNDCDGLIDEEYCYNGIDEDGDGRMNEDCAALPVCERRGSSMGLEFVGAFMENRPDQWAHQPLELIIARGKPVSNRSSAISVKIQTPLLDETLTERIDISTTIDASKNTAKVSSLPEGLRVTGARVCNKGFLVRANSSVSVYGFNKELFTSDSFLQLPADSLGTDYYAITYEPSLLYTEMAIVALYSDTIVTVTFLADKGDTDIPRIEMEWEGKSYTNGDSVRIRLQPFQVAQLQTEYDLTGTHVTSNLPVAFYSGNIRTWIRDDVSEQDILSRDHLVEQIPPTDTWGTRFVTQKYPPQKGEDRVHVIASQADTVVDVTSDGPNGEEKSRFTLVRPGTSYQLRVKPNTRISLVASKPIMAAQLTHSQMADTVPNGQQTDPSLIYIVPVNQFSNEYFFETSDYVGQGHFTTYVVLTVKEGFENSIWLDGGDLQNLPEPVTWTRITMRGNESEGEPQTVRYLQSYVKVADGVHRIRSISQNPFGAVQWAVGDRNTYAHPLGMRWRKNDCPICKQVICGDHVDNDCDGRVDEEKCDGTDSDHDGLIDEDCSCKEGSKPFSQLTTLPPRRTTSSSTPQENPTTMPSYRRTTVEKQENPTTIPSYRRTTVEEQEKPTTMPSYRRTTVEEHQENPTTMPSYRRTTVEEQENNPTTIPSYRRTTVEEQENPTTRPSYRTPTVEEPVLGTCKLLRSTRPCAPSALETVPTKPPKVGPEAVSSSCSTELPFRSVQICYGTSATLSCQNSEKISILTANYGRVNYFGEKTCSFGNPLFCDAANPACPYLDAYKAISEACDKRQSCSLTVSSSLLSEQLSQLVPTCKLQATYVDISYVCADLTEVSACTFTPASRLLGPTNEFQLTASSFASCPCSPQKDENKEQCDIANFCPSQNQQCRPSLATFDHSALEAWCPSLADAIKPWLVADLGAPYVVLGVAIQGRRRFLSQYTKEIAIYTSNNNKTYNRIETITPQTSFLANNNSIQIALIYFQTANNVARYVKVEVLAAEEHPALHLEVIIHNQVNGCESFRGRNTNMNGKRGTLEADTVVRCLGDLRTEDGKSAYVTRCRKNGKWSVEVPCN